MIICHTTSHISFTCCSMQKQLSMMTPRLAENRKIVSIYSWQESSRPNLNYLYLSLNSLIHCLASCLQIPPISSGHHVTRKRNRAREVRMIILACMIFATAITTALIIDIYTGSHHTGI